MPPLDAATVRAFLAQPEVSALFGAHANTADLVRSAHGAPGTLIGAEGRGAAVDRARMLLTAARGGRERVLRASFAQGSSKARGAFTDVLDALTVLLHERAREAAQDGDGAAADGAARAVRCVEDAKRAAEGNAVPQLVTAQLLRQLAECGA
jgi:DNA polymerase-3 subunit delta'